MYVHGMAWFISSYLLTQKLWMIVQLNLDYPDIDYPDFFSGPVFFMNINDV